ncbi:MAG: ribonuclease HII, partial [Rhodospirillales bacterium]
AAASGLDLVDGNRPPLLPSAPGCVIQCLVGGDGRSLSIAAASIAAKVTRDRLMAGLAERHPGYGWERNAGYGTAAHKAALERLGVTPEHRKSYKPILNILRGGES